jgi:beta-fructofuranosidase
VCLATSADGLLTWEKHPANPVIAGPPAELAAGAENDFRDPYVWREDEAWHLVLGCKQKGQGGMILRYRSADLVQWEYVGVLWRGDQHQTEPVPSGTMWECPNYYMLDGRRVLIYSAYSSIERVQYPVYYAASDGDQPFAPNAQGILVHGPAFYAPHGRRLADSRTVLWGWLKEASPEAMQVEMGWSGTLTLPLVLTGRPDGGVGVQPADEVKSLRGRYWSLDDATAGAIRGDCLELEAALRPGSGGLRLRAAPNGAEHTDIRYDAERQQVVVDTRAASLNDKVTGGAYTLPARPDANGQVRLRLFLDRSVLEVFTPEGGCLAARIYPTREDSLGVSAAGDVAALEAWEMGSIC